MSAKTGGQQGRRTPLSLSTGIPKLQQQQQNQKSSSSSSNNSATNGSTNNKNDHQNNHQSSHQQNKQEKSSGGDGKNSLSQKDSSRANNKKNHQEKDNNLDTATNGVQKSSNHDNNKQNGANDAKQNLKDNSDEKLKEKESKAEKKNERQSARQAAAERDRQEKDSLNAPSGKQASKKDKDSKDSDENNSVGEKKAKESENVPNKNNKNSDKIVETEKPNDNKNSNQTIEVTEKPKEDEAMDTSSTSESKALSTPSSRKRGEQKETKTPTPTKPSTSSSAKNEKTPQKSQKTPNKAEKTSSPKSNGLEQTPTKNSGAYQMDDEDMEPILVEPSPIKNSGKDDKGTSILSSIMKSVCNPAATSTPGKPLANKSSFLVASEVASSSPEPIKVPRSFSSISGRRSIRPANDYTPSKFQSNMPFRESYRRINTDLDFSTATNTSLNVTVGSEIPNNTSFSSFFFRGRKRDRTPSSSNLASDIQMETSPPKRARLEGFLNVVSSPFSILRSRLSKVTLHNNSLPVKLETKLANEEEDIDEVLNLSGGDEEVSTTPTPTAVNPEPSEEKANDNNITIGQEAIDEKAKISNDLKEANSSEDVELGEAPEKSADITEGVQKAEVEVQPSVKKSNCLIM